MRGSLFDRTGRCFLFVIRPEYDVRCAQHSDGQRCRRAALMVRVAVVRRVELMRGDERRTARERERAGGQAARQTDTVAKYVGAVVECHGPGCSIDPAYGGIEREWLAPKERQHARARQCRRAAGLGNRETARCQHQRIVGRLARGNSAGRIRVAADGFTGQSREISADGVAAD